MIRNNDCLLAAILPLLIGILALIKFALSLLFVVPRIMYEEEAKKSGQLAHMRGLLRSYRRRPRERYISDRSRRSAAADMTSAKFQRLLLGLNFREGRFSSVPA